MTYNILFWPDINYEPGHWRPVMSMADKVRNKIKDEFGAPLCNLKFLCTPECNPIITNANLFAASEIIPVLSESFDVGYSSLANEKPEEAHSRIDHCLKIAEGALDEEIISFAPDLLIAGYFVSMEALLIQYRYNRIRPEGSPEMKLMITTTFLRHPNEDPAITSLRFLAHHSQETSSRLMHAATDDSTFNGTFQSVQDFIAPLEDVTEMITCPKILDHDHFEHTREKTHYVEPCILDSAGSPQKDPMLIYASAGSRVRDYVESARKMFRVLQSMVELNTASMRKLEMAVGYTLKEEFFSTDNITIINWADQASSLKRARSAVVHGGLATIKECIYFGIPPIIIPLGKDQMDNALRVVNKKVGSLMMLDTITDKRLYNAILNAESNLETQRNIEEMKNVFHNMENPAESALTRSLQLIQEELGILSGVVG